MVFSSRMRATDLIMKKRDGASLDPGEIAALVNGYVDGSIPEYQVSAWLMAVFFRGMTPEETGALTKAMIESGATIDLCGLGGPLVDKHSTGGVGDKVSLILAPVAAACGVQVPMMSGRALGHTGGTLDKLESIPGYTTALSAERFRAIIGECGYAMTGQSEAVVPADRLLYALRDVTATVESIPLITASIMSKKFAEGAASLVFDVKTGSGAFMKSLDDSRALARSLVDTGRSLERGAVAVITRMDEPLGFQVGNFLEVEESAYCLMGDRAPREFRRPDDLMEVTLRLTAWMLVSGGCAQSLDEADRMCRRAIDSGAAWERFLANVELQGGEASRLEKELGRRRAPERADVTVGRSGYVASIDAFEVGMAGVGLGVGRSRTEDQVNPEAGVTFHAKVGDRVDSGGAVATVWGGRRSEVDAAAARIGAAVTVSDSAPTRESLVVEEMDR